MKRFFRLFQKSSRAGFSLVEAAFSIGLLSFGFLSLIPLLALGLKDSRIARDNHIATEIVQTLTQEAKQNVLTAGTTMFDIEGNPCSNSSQATYRVVATSSPLATDVGGSLSTEALSRWTLRVVPVGAPDRARTYAIVVPATTTVSP